MANEIHLNDIGHVFEITVKDDDAPRNISGATALTVYLRDPTGTVVAKTGTLTTDGTDGKFEYATVNGDLHTAGWWEIQGGVTEGSSPIFRTAIAAFEVKGNLS